MRQGGNCQRVANPRWVARANGAGTPRGETPAVRPAKFDDYPQIKELQLRYRLQARSRVDWEYLWTGNPAFREAPDIAQGWCLERAGRLVGFFGNIPVLYRFRGRPLLAVTGHSWVVDEAYRTYGILLLDEFLGQTRPELFLNTTANKEAAEAFGAFGAQRVPVGEWDQAGFWVTNGRQCARAWLHHKLPALSGPLSYPGGALLGFLEPNVTADAREVRQLTWFDARFDQFWNLLRQTSEGLIAERSREALEWHYHLAAKQKTLWIATIHRAGRLVSYGIFLRHDSAKAHLSRMRIIDFQTIEDDCDDYTAILSWASSKCRKEKIGVLECVGPTAALGGTQVAPHYRQLPSWTYFYKARDPQLAAELTRTSYWNPTLFDGDASI